MPPIRSRIDVGTASQVLDGCVEIAVADPAEHVRVALARARPATVEEQHAVAVPDQHAGLLLRA